jgi:hypothetical protein
VEKLPLLTLKVPNSSPPFASQKTLYGPLLLVHPDPETVTVVPGVPEDGFKFKEPACSGAARTSTHHKTDNTDVNKSKALIK